MRSIADGRGVCPANRLPADRNPSSGADFVHATFSTRGENEKSMRHRRDRVGDRDGAPGHVGVQPLHHLTVERDRAARGVFRPFDNAAMILRAWATSSAGGVKMALQASIWPGWIRVLPSKPRSRPCAHSWPKPSTLLKSL